MPAVPPPADCPSATGPKLFSLAAGTVLWRVHRVGHDATDFRSTGAVQKRADPKRHGAEGRFDCQTGEYGYLYAGQTKKTTIAEAFLRGDVVADPSARILRRAKADNTVLSRIEVVADLTLVDLRGAAGLGRVGQTDWLTSCNEDDYPMTQQWAMAIRRWAASTSGLIWQSKRDDVHFALVLFDDGAAPGGITGRPHRRLDAPLGRTLLEKSLAEFNVVLG
jgi:hypothetical protein